MATGDGIGWKASCRVLKWNAEQVAWVVNKTGILEPSGQLLLSLVEPYEIAESEGNVTTYGGLAYLWSLATGLTTAISAASQLANGFLPVGVGDGSGTVPTTSPIDADLTAATNKYYQPVDATYPQVGAAGATAGSLTVQATFGATAANFTWNEWGLFGTTSAFSSGTTATPQNATMINHRGVNLGPPKVSGNVWTLDAVITLS